MSFLILLFSIHKRGEGLVNPGTESLLKMIFKDLPESCMLYSHTFIYTKCVYTYTYTYGNLNIILCLSFKLVQVYTCNKLLRITVFIDVKLIILSP